MSTELKRPMIAIGKIWGDNDNTQYLLYNANREKIVASNIGTMEAMCIRTLQKKSDGKQDKFAIANFEFKDGTVVIKNRCGLINFDKNLNKLDNNRAIIYVVGSKENIKYAIFSNVGKSNMKPTITLMNKEQIIKANMHLINAVIDTENGHIIIDETVEVLEETE